MSSTVSSVHSVDLTDEELIALFLKVRDKVNAFLRPNWVCLVDSYGIHLLLISSTLEKSVQRRLTFFASGKIGLSVHCTPLNSETYLTNLMKPKSLSSETVSYYVDRIVQVIEEVRKFEIQGEPGLQVKNSRACRGYLGKYFGTAHYGSETYPKGAGRV